MTTVLVEWLTGECWRCDRSLLVTWVGPARWAGHHAPVYLCEGCLTAVEQRARQHVLARHTPVVPLPEPVVRPYRTQPPPTAVPARSGPAPAVPDPRGVEPSGPGLGVRVDTEGRPGRGARRTPHRRRPRLTLVVAATFALLIAAAIGTVAVRVT
ncbi:hypothetical protein JNUCC64_09065 [Streptomyces sp. JNUCC 64]